MQMIVVANTAHIDAPTVPLVPIAAEPHPAMAGPQGLDPAVAKVGFIDTSKSGAIDKTIDLDKKAINAVENHFREHSSPKGPTPVGDLFTGGWP